MPKKDISMIALVFFLTRCFFNLYTFTSLFSYLITSLSIFIAILIFKKLKIKTKNIKVFKWLYFLSLLIIFINILINSINFININYFRYKNYISIGLSLVTLTYILGKNKIKTISSISEVFLFTFIILASFIYIGLISLIKIDNYINFLKIDSIKLSILPYMLLFVLFYIRKNNIITGYLLGVSSSFIDIILLIGCLGSKLPKAYTYPGISIMKTITFFNFINHLDKLFSFIYLFEYTVTLALIFNILKNIIKESF